MKLRRIVGVSAAVVLATAAGAACSDEDSVFNAEVGDCVEDVSDLVGSVSELPAVDCTETHDGEIIALFQHEGDDDDFPGEDTLQQEAAEDCQGEEFEDYTGTEYSESAIIVGFITPSEDSWGEGDRETICVASVGEPVDVSFEDNGEDFLLGGSADDGGSDAGGSDDGSGDGGGDDNTLEEFADLVDQCEGGDNAACDELYANTPIGSEAETVGALCGGRSDERLNGTCEIELG
jgi:hypothetical protein